jgi:glycosyltransferase involved in cell wall biosynthesis
LYCYATKKIKHISNIPIISGVDSQWRGGLQWGHILLSKFRHQTWYTRILVAGTWQYEYARRLGFDKNHIISPLYSANVELFETVPVEQKQEQYPHQLLYIGRLSKEKGLLQLLEAWKNIKDKKDWLLTIIGNGNLKSEVLCQNDVKLIDFVSQEILCEEMSKSGCFILPSTFEPWALVIHEAATAGLPILATKVCGATTQFLINKYNGYLMEPNNVKSIEDAISNIIATSDIDLLKMGERSKKLSRKITPEYVAAAILSTIKCISVLFLIFWV